MSLYLKLKGITDVTNQLLLESIVQGVRSFLEWGILEAGGFITVPVSTPGINDQYADEILHSVHQEGMADNRIWEAIHWDWVYETGGTASPGPVLPTGVYVNGTLYPTASTVGAFKHYINFPEGRVVFDSPISATSVVQATYSYRSIHLYDHEVPWFRDVVFDPLVPNDTSSTIQDVSKLLDEYRVQLPAVIIEPVMNRRLRGIMLGSGAQWVEQDILFHVISDRADERNNIVDILSLQIDKTFYLYDVNARRNAGDYPLDWRGVPRAGAKMYPAIVAEVGGYRWKSCYFSRMVNADVSLRLPYYRGIVRSTIEVDFNSI